MLKQGSNIISYNSKQRSNVSRTFLFIKKTLSIARVSFNEPRLPKNTLGINGIFFVLNFRFERWLRTTLASFATKIA